MSVVSASIILSTKGKLMENMAEDYGWSMDDFWEEEPLTPEEQLASDRAQAQVAYEEMIGEMYASRYAFD
jgi:hypothetical protein